MRVIREEERQLIAPPPSFARRASSPWRGRSVSWLTVTVLIVAFAELSLFAICQVLLPEVSRFPELAQFLASVSDGYPLAAFVVDNALALSAIFFLLALVGEFFSRWRVPPPNWRVKRDLTRALIDLGALSPYQEDWKGRAYWVAPFGAYNRASRSYAVMFNIRSACATDQLMEKLTSAPAAFSHAQQLSVENLSPKLARGRRECFLLTVWYAPFAFGSIEAHKPW